MTQGEQVWFLPQARSVCRASMNSCRTTAGAPEMGPWVHRENSSWLLFVSFCCGFAVFVLHDLSLFWESFWTSKVQICQRIAARAMGAQCGRTLLLVVGMMLFQVRKTCEMPHKLRWLSNHFAKSSLHAALYTVHTVHPFRSAPWTGTCPFLGASWASASLPCWPCIVLWFSWSPCHRIEKHLHNVVYSPFLLLTHGSWPSTWQKLQPPTRTLAKNATKPDEAHFGGNGFEMTSMKSHPAQL